MCGERLIKLRKEAHLSQRELAEILNLNKHTISSYELHKTEPSDEIKVRIAAIFHVSLDYLLGVTKVRSSFNIDIENRCVFLPKEFPDNSILELETYIEFLLFKQKLCNFSDI